MKNNPPENANAQERDIANKAPKKLKELCDLHDDLVIEALTHIKKICGGQRGLIVPVIYELYDIARTNNVNYICAIMDSGKKDKKD